MIPKLDDRLTTRFFKIVDIKTTKYNNLSKNWRQINPQGVDGLPLEIYLWILSELNDEITEPLADAMRTAIK